MNESTAVLRDKRVVIVGGGGGGIGACCTRLIGAAGAQVAIVDINQGRAEQAAKDVVNAGGRAHGLTGDVGKLADIQRFIDDADRALGGIDALVTVVGGINAFKIPFARTADQTDQDWDTMFEFNLRYVYRTVRLAIPRMLEHGRGGAIVAIGSYAGGHHGAPMMGSYGAAKAGVAHLAMTVAAEYGPQNIRMNVVSPGWTETPISGHRSDSQTEKLLGAIPLRRRGNPEDIGNAVLYFLSPAANYISGQILTVDGGASAYSHFLNAGWS